MDPDCHSRVGCGWGNLLKIIIEILLRGYSSLGKHMK